MGNSGSCKAQIAGVEAKMEAAEIEQKQVEFALEGLGAIYYLGTNDHVRPFNSRCVVVRLPEFYIHHHWRLKNSYSQASVCRR